MMKLATTFRARLMPVLAVTGLACHSAATTPRPSAPRTTVPDSGGPLQIAFPDQGLILHLGPRETLLLPGVLPGMKEFPEDIGPVVLRRSPVRALMAAGPFVRGTTYLVTGSDWKHLTGARPVLTAGGPGSFDNGEAVVTGVYRHGDGRLFAVYYAQDLEGMPGESFFYGSQGLAVSSDEGESWTKLGQVITSSRSKSAIVGNGLNEGGATISSAVVSPDGAWWYVYYTEFFRAEYPHNHISLSRARVGDRAPAPGAFFKYHNGAFDQPGLAGLESPVLSLETDSVNVADPHVLWSQALKQYVMTLNVRNKPEFAGEVPVRRSGVAIAYSGDGIHWSKPTNLFTDYSVPIGGKSLTWQATVVLDRDDGLEGWLLYAYSPRFGSPPENIPHYLVGRRVRFERRR